MKQLIIYWSLISIALFISTFVFYVAIMKMREIKHEIYALHWSVRWICFFILACGLIFDWLLDWFVLTPAFLEFPKEFLSTARVVRHKYESTGWRQKQAMWWCKNFLVVFDSTHCER